MDYKQVKFTRFVSPTTCYSGLKRLSEKGAGTIATETESIRYSAPLSEISGYPIPKPCSDEIPCVGHDCLDDQQIFVLLESSADGDLEDQATVMNASNNSTSEAVWNSSRRTSLSSDAMSVVTTTDVSTTAATIGMSTTVPPVSDDDEPSHTSYLAWRNGDEVATTSSPCRLLAPTISRVSSEKEHLVWAGSADDFELRCFAMRDGDIKTVALDGFEAFTSPIMAIQSCNDTTEEPKQTLVIGCQDGTVRLISFSCRINEEDKVIFENLRSHTVIVDGPILSLALTNHQRLLFVGSMCGYVCQLKRGDENDDWGEPTMVVKDFWDTRYEADDPVLALHYWNNRVILGTYSGLVQVHVLLSKDKKYAVEWSCPLPHPVHAITHVGDTIVVTTKETLHVFEAKPIYSADRAKEQLERLLRK